MVEHGVIFPQGFDRESIVEPDWVSLNQRHSNFEYFEKEYYGKGMGKEYLVMKSTFQEKTIPNNIHIHAEDTKLHLKIAELVNTCTRGQRDILGDILHLTVNSAQRVHEGASIPIPQTGKELRRVFVSNKYSLLNTIPHPPVSFLSDFGIAMVTLTDCLTDFLAQGTPFQSIVEDRLQTGMSDLYNHIGTDCLYDRYEYSVVRNFLYSWLGSLLFF